MTQTNVIHREHLVVRGADGAIARTIETERTEDAAVHAKCVAAAKAVNDSSVSELPMRVKRLGAELDALNVQASRDRARIRELEQTIVDHAAARDAELRAFLEVDAKSEQRQADRDKQLLEAMADVRDAHLAYREATTPYVMPTEMVDLEALAAFEQELMDVLRREGKPISGTQLHWVLPVPRGEEAA